MTFRKFHRFRIYKTHWVEIYATLKILYVNSFQTSLLNF